MTGKAREQQGAMEPEELRAIINAFGPDGKQILADLMPTTIRTIDRWLGSQRNIQRVEAARIRSLADDR